MIPCKYDVSMLSDIHNFRYSGVDSNRIKILMQFYPDKLYASRDVAKYNCNYQLVTLLAKSHYLQKIDNLHIAARYKITLKGKCKVLCYMLGINFISLCILTEAYVQHKSQIQNQCKLSYILHDMYDIFDGLYCPKTIQNAASILCSRGLTIHIANHTIYLHDASFQKLKVQESVIYEIHEWILGIQHELNHLALTDSKLYDKIKRRVLC